MIGCGDTKIKGLSGCEKYFATPSPTPAPTPAPLYGLADSDDSLAADEEGTTATTPAPVVQPAIRYNLETMAHEWCPRVPLSECVVDSEGVDSGDVRSLHASFYVSRVSSPDLAPNHTQHASA